MKFCWVTINVKDMEKSLEFYRDIVGLSIHRQFAPQPGDQITFVGSDDGETEIELIQNAKVPAALLVRIFR